MEYQNDRTLEERIEDCPIHKVLGEGGALRFATDIGIPPRVAPLFQELVLLRGEYPAEMEEQHHRELGVRASDLARKKVSMLKPGDPDILLSFLQNYFFPEWVEIANSRVNQWLVLIDDVMAERFSVRSQHQWMFHRMLAYREQYPRMINFAQSRELVDRLNGSRTNVPMSSDEFYKLSALAESLVWEWRRYMEEKH